VNIFIAKMNFRTTDRDLTDLFSQFGEVALTKVIADRDTGRSKGYGFVEMPNDAEALAAIAALNGRDFDGRTILVKESTPR